MISIVVAERHELARRAFRALLEQESGVAVIGEAGGIAAAAEMLDRMHPDVLLLGPALDDIEGLRLLQRATAGSPRTRIVAVIETSDTRERESNLWANELLQIGLGGYVLRSDPADDLLEAVRSVAGGGRHVSPALARQAAVEVVRQPEAAERGPRKLSRREREILELLAEGHGNTEIGRRLFISPRTVETHRANILRKLNLRTRSDLVQYALRQGWLRHPDR
ncbi:MAG TPA: response regulator transcription factor [Vicinamibacterales bacterium]|jgi:DNA-binding NarL/FixJ family response regulator